MEEWPGELTSFNKDAYAEIASVSDYLMNKIERS